MTVCAPTTSPKGDVAYALPAAPSLPCQDRDADVGLYERHNVEDRVAVMGFETPPTAATL